LFHTKVKWKSIVEKALRFRPFLCLFVASLNFGQPKEVKNSATKLKFGTL